MRRSRLHGAVGGCILAAAALLAGCSESQRNPVAPTAAATQPALADLTPASVTTVLWDFAAMYPTSPDPADLGTTETFSITGNGSIDGSTGGAGEHITVKGMSLAVGATERGLGLCLTGDATCTFPADGDEVGDGGDGTLRLDFSGVLPAGSMLDEIDIGSLQATEGYSYRISTDGGTTFSAFTNVSDQGSDSDPNAVLTIGLPTANLVIEFRKDPNGGASVDNDYVVKSATTSFTETVGCTLTQGFWKNHEEDWPAGFDPDASFFGGDSWIDILNTPPRHGNEFLILAHQYIAAELNVASGASTTAEVADALSDATDYFNGTSFTRDQVIALAGTLDTFNNGLAAGGPPHCGD